MSIKGNKVVTQDVNQDILIYQHRNLQRKCPLEKQSTIMKQNDTRISKHQSFTIFHKNSVETIQPKTLR